MPDITAKFSTNSLEQIEGVNGYANNSDPASGFDDGNSTTGILQLVGQAGPDNWECKLVTEDATPDKMRRFARGFRLFVKTKTNNDVSKAPADLQAMLAAAESAVTPPGVTWDEIRALDKADIAKETDKADPKTGSAIYEINKIRHLLLDKYIKYQKTFESEFYKALTPTTTPLEGEYDINDYFNDEYTVSISKTDANKTGETFSPEKQGYAITLKLDPTGWDNDLDEKWESGTWTIKTDLRGLVTSITFSNDYSVENNLVFQSNPTMDFTVMNTETKEENSFSVGLEGNSVTPKLVTSLDVFNKLQYILSLAPEAFATDPSNGSAIKLTPQQSALLTVIGNQLKKGMGLKLENDESTFLDREKFKSLLAPPTSPAAGANDPTPPTTPTSGGIDVTQ